VSVRPLSRRRLLRVGSAAAAASTLAACAGIATQGKARIVVIGGGFGGASAAREIRRLDPAISVSLIEPNRSYITCPFSNHVLGGFRRLEELTQNYAAFEQQHRIDVFRDSVIDIDPGQKTVTLAGGRTLPYDRLIIAPGIDMRWNALPGYTEAIAERLPHAWKAGAQTTLLRRQLEAMPDGGVFLMSVPPNPYRCPPGPYERASLVAHYFKQANPRAKILILDAKDNFSKQALFQDGWKALYGDMIEWVPLSKDGRVTRVLANDMTVATEFGQRHKAAVINIVPPQFAGKIAREAELTNQTGWCPVDPGTFESTIHKGVHVIGDACIAGAMPKSAFAAALQGKVAAHAAVSVLAGKPMLAPPYLNTCYSLLAPDYGISVADVYRVTAQGITAVRGAGGTSPRNANAAFREREARYAEGWYAATTAEIWRG
jgi:sulfide dehydrogenase [flavocytochrome c] flavoprotein subunit